MGNSVCDLHIHSHYSDGRASPAEILHHAASIGLNIIAITDHDSLHGVAEAGRVAAGLGLEIIPGIELTGRWDACASPYRKDGLGQDVDLLGYFFNSDAPAFQEFVQAALSDLTERISACCDRLTAAGYPISLYDVQDENPHYPGTIQLISALWRKGYADSYGSAFLRFAEEWQAVRLSHWTVAQVIAAIHAAGGAAVLAHPIAVACPEGQLSRQQLGLLVEAGLDGLEVYHPRLDTAARQHFLKLAGELDLVVTGGSDEHGEPGRFARMGSELITRQMVNDLRQRAERYKG